MQWGAEEWQFADLYMPDDASPYQTENGLPCIMLIHGGFWKQKYGLELMKPIAQDLADSGVAAWNIEFEDGRKMMKVCGWIHYQMFLEHGGN